MIWMRCMRLPGMKRQAAEPMATRLHYLQMYRTSLKGKFQSIMEFLPCFLMEPMW